MNLQSVLQSIYDSGVEVAVAIRDEWDCGWQVTIGDVTEPLAADLTEAAQWLHDQMLSKYPHSKYEARWRELSHAASQPSPNLCELLNALYQNEDRVGLQFISGKGWDVTYNHTVERVASLPDVARWLHEKVTSFSGNNVKEASPARRPVL